jgi:predicted nucleic acid-binding protein
MPYLVDTDWAIDYLAGVPEAVTLLNQLAGQGIAIAIVTYMEIYQGVERTPNPRRTAEQIAAFLENVPVVPFSLAVARRCAKLREELRRQGKRVSSRALDLIVAATTLEHDLTLVTRNCDDYRDVPGLKLHGGASS